MLDEIRVASPCSADWDEMSGDARVRFCGKCEKNVYNLSQMTRDEAESLVREKEGRLCVRFYMRADGTMLTQDCPIGVEKKRLRQRVWRAFSSVAASAAILAGLAGGRARADLCVKDGKPAPTQPKPPLLGHVNPKPPEMMGKIAMPPPPVQGGAVVKMGEPLPRHLMGDVAIAPEAQRGTPKK